MLEAYQKRFDLFLYWKLDHFSREGNAGHAAAPGRS
jgi:hypothetical protein